MGVETSRRRINCDAFHLSGGVLLVLLLFTAVVFIACSGEECQDLDTAENRYKQIEVHLPEGIQSVGSLEKTNSGKVWMVGAKDDFVLLWELNDDNSWKEISNINELLSLDTNDYVIAAPIAKSNKVLCFTLNLKDLSDGIKIFLIDFELEDNYCELDIDTSLITGELSYESANFQLSALKDDRFLIQNYDHALFILDINNETFEPIVSNENSEEWHLESAAELDGIIYILSQREDNHHSVELNAFELISGTLNSVDYEKYDELAKLFDTYDGSGMIPALEGNYKQGQQEKITICLNNGVLEYGNNGLVGIADAKDTVIADPSKIVVGCVFDESDDFFLLCVDYSDPEEIPPFLLYKYEKGVNVKEASNTIHIWTLEDNVSIRQAIAFFKDEYTDVEIDLEIGLNEEETTAQEALQKLTVDVLAGCGPDIFFLDGLPVDSFIEQEMLHDLTDIYTEAAGSELYHDNIINAFVSDNECKVIPMRYTFPHIIAEKDTLIKLENLPSLVEATKEILSKDPGSMVFCNMAIFDDLFVAAYPELLVEGQVKEDALIHFFEDVYNLYDLLQMIDRQESIIPEPDREGNNSDEAFDFRAISLTYLLEDSNQILIDQILAEEDFGYCELFLQNSESNLVGEVFSVNQNYYFVPKVCVAVSVDSKEIELSESFIRVMLSERYQKINHRDGLSIMTSTFLDAVENPFGVTLVDGSDLYIDSLTKETIVEYQKLFSSLDTPVVVDRVIQTIVFQELQSYLASEITSQEAVEACSKKINLYLAD